MDTRNRRQSNERQGNRANRADRADRADRAQMARDSQASFASGARARRGVEGEQIARPSLRTPILVIVAAVVVLSVIISAGRMCSQAASIDVTLNGSSYTLRGDKTMQTAISVSGWPVNPGDLISLQGNVLKRDAGNPFLATVNGQEVVDPAFQLHNGDEITLTDGTDIVEDYDTVEESIPYGMRITSLGAIHTFEDGAEGVKEIRTGHLSGEVVEKQTVDPTDAHENRYDPDPGDVKVVALTFDDGPSEEYTRRILEVLADNDAKATFFCRGDRVQGEGADIVREEAEQGHLVCTHSYDNASSVKGDMTQLSAEEQRAQLQQGYAALADALGYEPCHLVRMGSGDMAEWVALNVFDLVDAEIGWTIDTGDWIYMTEDDIYNVLMSAKPGSIVRMHDAGDYQNATIAALKRALPKLAKKGYSFVTVEELMQY